MSSKRSVTIDGHSTSVSLEDAFWEELRDIAARQGVSLAALIAQIDHERGTRHALSSALRLHVLDDLKSRLQSVSSRLRKSSGGGSGPSGRKPNARS